MTSRASKAAAPFRLSQCDRHRCGFTLLELLLVLAIIVLVGTMSLPVFQTWMASYRIQEGMDQLRTQIVRGRTLAMNEGRLYRLGWQPGSSDFRIAPDTLEQWPELAGTVFGPRFSGMTEPPGTVIEAMLPAGIVFLQSPDGLTSVVFRPDGTARLFAADGSERMEGLILLSDDAGQMRALRLRGLTGHAVPVRPEELPLLP